MRDSTLPRKIVLMLVSICAAVVLVEGLARLFLAVPRYHSRLIEYDGGLGFRGVPFESYTRTHPVDGASHTVALNADGFRGRALPTGPAEPGVRRIVMLGDSFLVGESVAEQSLLTTLVEQQLSERNNPAEVYNLSAVDYGTGQQLLLYDRFREQISPDLVVLALYPANDVVNNSLGLAGRTRVSPGDGVRPYLRFNENGDREITWVSPARSLSRRLLRSFAWVERGLFPPIVEPHHGRAPFERLRLAKPPREFLEVFARHDPGHRWEVAWQETFALIAAIRDRCLAGGAQLIVVVIPSEHQVGLTPRGLRLESESLAAGRSLEQMIDWNSPEQRLIDFASREQIELAILLGDFRDQARAGDWLYDRDHHLSESGHALAAEKILVALEADATPVGAVGQRLSRRAVDWPTESDSIVLDFTVEPHGRHVGDGFIEWQPASEFGAGGWEVGAEAMLVVRLADGALVVSGEVGQAVELEIGVVGGESRRFEIPQAGVFEVRLGVERGRGAASRGHVAVGIRVVGGPAVVNIREVGFAERVAAP